MTEESGDLEIGADFSDYPNTAAGWAQRWMAEFAYAKEFHRKWKTSGKEIVSKWLMRDIKTNDPQGSGYNLGLFWANVKTMSDMLYGRVPQVSVDRRWADPNDQVARVAAEMATRILNADIEECGEDFSTVLRNCLQDRLLPGLGCVRVRYDLEEGEQADEKEKSGPAKLDEWLEDIYVPWMDLMWSPARTWKEIRWISFRTYKNKKELASFLGKKETDPIFKSIPFNSKNPMEQLSSKTSTIWNKAEIWEVWSREHGFVFWLIEGFPTILKSIKDPLELSGFFPCPPFFIANPTTMEYVPKGDYTFSEALYKEIDVLSERISLLTKAIKVVGVYDKKAAPDIGRLVNETAENKLIPVDSWAVFQERGGIKGCIEFLPIESIVEAVAKLQEQKQARIAELYQVTGMSDILRGEADERQQVGTQQLKAKFASIRVQAIQDEFTRFATDLQKLRLELICKFFEPEQMIARANMQQTYDAQKAMDAALFLKNEEVSKWRVMIAPESMSMVDYSQLRMERTEYINALGIFLQSSFPIAEKFPQATPILLQLLKWGLAGFKGSKEIEGLIEQVTAEMTKTAQQAGGQPQHPDPKVMAEQLKMQQSQQEHQGKMQEMSAKHSMDMQKMMLEFKAEMMEIMARMSEASHETEQGIHQNTSKMLAQPPPPPLSLGDPGAAQPGAGNGVSTQ